MKEIKTINIGGIEFIEKRWYDDVVNTIKGKVVIFSNRTNNPDFIIEELNKISPSFAHNFYVLMKNKINRIH